MKACAIILVVSASCIKIIKANNGCKAEDKADFLPVYPKDDSCAMSYDFLYDSRQGCASNCVSCGLCSKCLDHCISCVPGYEIDVMY